LAKIFPELLPENIKSDPKRNAEINVYQAFQKLDDDYRVFYSASWQQRKIDQAAVDGEADFIVAHPKMGVIVFEVKGGGIALDANTGEWTSTDRNSQVHIIKDPIDQARRNRYALKEKLSDLPGWDQTKFLNMGQAVIFPDIIVPKQSLKPDIPREIVIDHHDLEEIDLVIPQIMRYYSSSNMSVGTLGHNRLSMLERLLAKSFSISTPMGVEINSLEDKLIKLTEDQMRILDFLGTRRKAAIKGCAGSGKTMLAVEKARRLFNEGFDVLLVCFNNALATYLSDKLPNISVVTFHQLCEALVKEADISPKKSIDIHEYYDRSLPEAGFDAAVVLGKKFDAIIVDEGQDFREEYWMVINELLDEINGILYIFYDDNQNLYKGSPINTVIEEEPFLLTENCRNTKLIHELVRNYHKDKEQIESRSPVGFQPEIIYFNSEIHLKNKLQSLLHKLVNEEHIYTDDIVILTPHSQAKTAIKSGTQLGNFVITENTVKRNNEIQCTSVYKFKGLESKVIIMVEIGPLIFERLKEIMYVGCSRAKSYLVLMIDDYLQPSEMLEIKEFCKVIS